MTNETGQPPALTVANTEAEPLEVSETDFQVITAQLGIDAETFIRSALGQHLNDRADQDIEENTALLVAANPNDLVANTDLRVNIRTAENFKKWMMEAIRAGHLAVKTLESMEQNTH